MANLKQSRLTSILTARASTPKKHRLPASIEIAEALSIKFGAVETHRRNLLVKLGARNTARRVRIGLEYGLLEP